MIRRNVLILDIDNTISPYSQIGHEVFPFHIPNPNPLQLEKLVVNTNFPDSILDLVHEVQVNYTKIQPQVIKTLNEIRKKYDINKVIIVSQRSRHFYQPTLKWLKRFLTFDEFYCMTTEDRIKFAKRLDADTIIMIDDNPKVIQAALFSDKIKMIPIHGWNYNKAFTNRFKERIEITPDFERYRYIGG